MSSLTIALTAPPMQHFRGHIETLPIAELHESPLNPRKTFKGMEELAESIRQVGLLSPITVRPKGNYYVSTGTLDDSPVRYVAVLNLAGRENLLHTFSHGCEAENQLAAEAEAERLNRKAGYEIAAGHRRYRAAKMAGLTEVTCIVKPMSDQQFVEMLTFENCRREDVHPLEEAAGFASLVKDYGYTAAAIAEKLGCAESYVHKRLQLTRLTPALRKAFEAEEITLAHAVQIARLEPANQKQAFDLCFTESWDHVSGKRTEQLVPAKLLDLRIREQLFLNLDAAPWKKDDAQLLPKAGACTSCAKRTGANHQLFDDLSSKHDNCLDAECYGRKRTAFVNLKCAQIEEKTGSSPVRVATAYADEKTLKQLQAVRDHTFEKVTAQNACEHAETAIVVYGNGVGSTFKICRTPDCGKHAGRYRSIYKKSPQQIAAERKQKTDAKIEAAYKDELWRRIWERLKTVDPERRDWERVIEALIDRLGHDGTKALGPRLALEARKSKTKWGGAHTDHKTPVIEFGKKLPDEEVPSFCVALAVAWRILGFGGRIEEVTKYAKDLALDPAAIKRSVSAPILAKAKAAAAREKKSAAVKSKDAPKGAAKKAKAAGDGELDDDELSDGDECEELED